ncbi:CsbD family protein [Sulfuricaulis sp.]|jgi:uncharacterized protein YjbJ (UPF0337 family)|uniref:CsbD family protein n=1 Tax=Sulfuricaulis sp. TaxID=2003553 RepID=UPI00355A8CD6
MNKDQFKARSKQEKGRIREISGKLFRDKLLEKKERAQKIGGRVQAGYGDFREDLQGYGDLKDLQGYGDFREDLQGYGDFRDDLQKSG